MVQSCSPGGASVLLWTHESSHSKRHFDRFSSFAQLMAESLYFKMGHPFNRQICPLCIGGSWPNLIRGLLNPSESATQMACQSVQQFLQGSQSWKTHNSICNNRPHLFMYTFLSPSKVVTLEAAQVVLLLSDTVARIKTVTLNPSI